MEVGEDDDDQPQVGDPPAAPPPQGAVGPGSLLEVAAEPHGGVPGPEGGEADGFLTLPQPHRPPDLGQDGGGGHLHLPQGALPLPVDMVRGEEGQDGPGVGHDLAPVHLAERDGWGGEGGSRCRR